MTLTPRSPDLRTPDIHWSVRGKQALGLATLAFLAACGQQGEDRLPAETAVAAETVPGEIVSEGLTSQLVQEAVSEWIGVNNTDGTFHIEGPVEIVSSADNAEDLITLSPVREGKVVESEEWTIASVSLVRNEPVEDGENRFSLPMLVGYDEASGRTQVFGLDYNKDDSSETHREFSASLLRDGVPTLTSLTLVVDTSENGSSIKLRDADGVEESLVETPVGETPVVIPTKVPQDFVDQLVSFVPGTAPTLAVPTEVVEEAPGLPEEFLDNPYSEGYVIEDDKVVVNGETWYELEDGQWVEKLWIYDALTSEEIAEIEFEGGENSWGVLYERLAGQNPDQSNSVVGIRGKVVSIYRTPVVAGSSHVAIDLLTQISGERKTLSFILGRNYSFPEGTADFQCNLSSSVGGSGFGPCSVDTVIDKVKPGDVLKVEAISRLRGNNIEYFTNNPDYKPGLQDTNTWKELYVFNNYDTYRSLIAKLIDGDVSSITEAETSLYLAIFYLGVE